MNATARILGAAALVGVGAALGGRGVEKTLPRLLAYLARTELAAARAERQVRRLDREVADAQEGLAELRASIPHVWDLAAKATRDHDVLGLVVAGVERQQRERGAWN